MATDCRSGSVGTGDRIAIGAVCDRQTMHNAQSCEGWPGFGCAGCVPSSALVWQIGTLPRGSGPMASGASEIVASRRTWHQTASNDAANPMVGFNPCRGTDAFRASTRRTGAHSACQSVTTRVAPCRRQACRRPSGERSASILYMLARRRLPSFNRNLSARRMYRVRKLGFHVGAISRGWARWIVPATLMMMLAAGILLSVGRTLGRPTAESEAFDSVYYAALLSGRDPDAAVRKARFTAGILMKQFGMTRPEAAAEVTKFMIWRSGRLCGG